ncbi:MAG TPA: 4Fe-4S dicluster domain-containing protein [Spirochaetota bacterium]|nr:4Fe-4S dicluster domain-containing protein [Spirochaetota bacterium]
MKNLKFFRIIVSSIISVSLIIVFTDFYKVASSWFINLSHFLQFIPSFLSFTTVISAAGTGFIFIILLTFLYGRTYCSFICPLGFFQDIFIRLGGILFRKKGFSYSKPGYMLFYSILAVMAISFIISGTTLLLWLDPFSIFGRFLTHTASLPLMKLNNELAGLLIKKDIFFIHSFEKNISSIAAAFSLSIFGLIMILSMFRGRYYCNRFCPVGGFLSLISRISLFRLSIDENSCIHCGKCEKICKSECIDHKTNYIDSGRCIACFNCLNQCPNGSISFTGFSPAPVKKKTPGSGEITRMSFLAGIILFPSLLQSKENNKTVLYYQEPLKQKQYKRKSFSSPPGSVSIDLLNSRCTACSLCISVCPTKVLQPSVMQYGLIGIMQPFMDFNSGFCNYDCTLCGEICPTGAIRLKDLDEKKQIRTGKSVFVIENCITYTSGTDCGACSEHCPTKAVHMVPFKNGLVIPEINSEICTGCGACEYACPVRPLRAIYVEGLKKHDSAKLPQVKKKEKIIEADFPF